MKKLTIFFLVITISLLIGVAGFAQTPQRGLHFQKVSFGALASVSGNTALSLSKNMKPFSLGYNLFPAVCIVTNKTYQNFFYGLNNTAKITNGYFLKENLGLYLTLVKNFSSKGGYMGMGVDVFNKKIENVAIILFPEIGVNIVRSSYSWLFTVGMKINVQVPIWKKKT